MVKLPAGSRTLEDMAMMEHLLKDEVFKESIEDSLGKVVRMYLDWPADRLFYELLSGKTKQSRISGILKTLKQINYMKEFEQ